jgi:putative tricarboxylic transport membrane protein
MSDTQESMTHAHSPQAERTIGRIAAVCLLTLAIAYGIGGSLIEYAFASDPLGPRVVPMGLAVVLGSLCLIYLKFPGSIEGFPTGLLLRRVLAVPAVLVVSALLFEPAGFAVSIFVLTLGAARLFGASWKTALLGAAGQALLWWLIFAYLLDVYLPAGALFG